MTKTKHTDAVMARLKCPPGKRNVAFPDASGNGLLVYVSDSGSKLWKYRFNYAKRKNDIITIGEWPTMKYDEAKAKAQWFERVRTFHQRDPKLAVYNPSKATTLEQVIEAYIAKLAVKTQPTVTSCLKPVRAKFGANPIADLTAITLGSWIEAEYAAKGNRPARAGAARTMLRYLAAALNQAIADKAAFDIPDDFTNPVPGLAKTITLIRDHQPGTHATAWEDDELKAIMTALRKAKAQPDAFHPFGVLALELGMLTGARPSELASLKWSEVHGVRGEPDLRHIIKTSHKTWKRTKRPRRITLGKRGVEVLNQARALANEGRVQSEFVFPARRMQTNSKVEHFNSANTLCRAISTAFLDFEIRPYHFRSGYINHALASADGNISSEEWKALLDQVAENVGHTDIKITLEHYAKTRTTTANRVARMADAAFDRFDEAA